MSQPPALATITVTRSTNPGAFTIHFLFNKPFESVKAVHTGDTRMLTEALMANIQFYINADAYADWTTHMSPELLAVIAKRRHTADLGGHIGYSIN